MSLIIMFAVRPICIQDSIFKMAGASPGLAPVQHQAIICIHDDLITVN